MDGVFEQIKVLNEELRKNSLCIPPYACVNQILIDDFSKHFEKGTFKANQITGMILLPAQRAYQMEYRYKRCEVFSPFLEVIEYATYDAMTGNWICAYLSFLPVVEAVFREWANKKEEEFLFYLDKKGIRTDLSALIEKLKKYNFFSDERMALTDAHIEYLEKIIGLFYARFDEYEDTELPYCFNRNLASHKLKGISNTIEERLNVSRILLLLDIIAELYLMKTPAKYWNIVFNEDIEHNSNYQKRWNFYIELSEMAVESMMLAKIRNSVLRDKM